MTDKQFIELKHILLTSEIIELWKLIRGEAYLFVVETETAPKVYVKDFLDKYMLFCALNSYSPRTATSEKVKDYLNKLYDMKLILVPTQYSKDDIFDCVVKSLERMFIDFDRKKKNTSIN